MYEIVVHHLSTRLHPLAQQLQLCVGVVGEGCNAAVGLQVFMPLALIAPGGRPVHHWWNEATNCVELPPNTSLDWVKLNGISNVDYLELPLLRDGDVHNIDFTLPKIANEPDCVDELYSATVVVKKSCPGVQCSKLNLAMCSWRSQ